MDQEESKVIPDSPCDLRDRNTMSAVRLKAVRLSALRLVRAGLMNKKNLPNCHEKHYGHQTLERERYMPNPA